MQVSIESMEADTLVEQLLGDPAVASRLEPLPDAVAQIVVGRLKQEADRYWGINANHSLTLAEAIIQIGQARGDTCQTALGTMARGDALKLLGRTVEAWEALGEAGDLFLTAKDEVGWARTRIGRLLICVDLNRVGEAFADAEQARAIFTRHDEQEKYLRLELNLAIVYDLLGEHEQALMLYHVALNHANLLGPLGEAHLGALYTNMGYAYDHLGNFRQALIHHERASALFDARNETNALATAQLNIAHIAMVQGQYRRALSLLHHARQLRIDGKLFLDAAKVDCDIVECYLLLNRYLEARDLAKEALTAYHSFNLQHKQGIVLLHLAVAEAELGNFGMARIALDAAEPIFAALGATSWVMTTHLRRGRIALQQGDVITAQREARSATAHYEITGQEVHYAAAMLLRGQASYASDDLAEAEDVVIIALGIAQRCNVPSLRYAGHLLLGRIAEARGSLTRAIRCYRAAAATVDRVQQSLTITLRPGFLEDKGEALRALLGLYLRMGRIGPAWESLECAKSQMLLGYLANREQLHWANNDDYSRMLVEELNQLRVEHQSFYRLAHEQLATTMGVLPTLSPDQALVEVKTRERRMHALTEQLYLRGGDTSDPRLQTRPSLSAIQRCLDEGTLLIEFYNDGSQFWAFTIDRYRLDVHRLSVSSAQIEVLLSQMTGNLNAALNVGPENPTVQQLSKLAQRIAQRLFHLLFEPFVQYLDSRQRLIIVPYGSLHYLPFHLLHTDAAYLIEQYEVVILPAAALLTQRRLQRTKGALVLAHSRAGRLPQTLTEGQIVQRLFGGDIYFDEAANRNAFQAAPRQILHIAAHGEHRLDNPDLSYIELADGQFYTDDLLQQDMSYELVTLSACEAGRAKVASSDELIGLGRGFLYAGAGALIVSLWRVADAQVVLFMEQLYSSLSVGISKAAALRAVERALLAANPSLHPAFWGAFQLMGDAGPLSDMGSDQIV